MGPARQHCMPAHGIIGSERAVLHATSSACMPCSCSSRGWDPAKGVGTSGPGHYDPRACAAHLTRSLTHHPLPAAGCCSPPQGHAGPGVPAGDDAGDTRAVMGHLQAQRQLRAPPAPWGPLLRADCMVGQSMGWGRRRGRRVPSLCGGSWGCLYPRTGLLSLSLAKPLDWQHPLPDLISPGDVCSAVPELCCQMTGDIVQLLQRPSANPLPKLLPTSRSFCCIIAASLSLAGALQPTGSPNSCPPGWCTAGAM